MSTRAVATRRSKNAKGSQAVSRKQLQPIGEHQKSDTDITVSSANEVDVLVANDNDHGTESDEAERKIDHGDDVKCQTPGCKAWLPAIEMKEHLKKYCRYVEIECHYSLFGCDWKGLRKDQEKHEKECPANADLDAAMLHIEESEQRSQEAGICPCFI